MILFLALLGFYFLVTGSFEIFFTRPLQNFFETCFKVKYMRWFSLWAFAVAGLAYLAVPAAGMFKWLLVFLVWLYGFLGLWILIHPELFRGVLLKTFFDSPEEMRYKMTRLDGMIRFIVALLVLIAAF